LADILGMPIDPKLKEEASIQLGHETALLLYRFFQPIGSEEAGLLMMWFAIYNEMLHQETKLKNSAALAAATEYIWRQFRAEKESQSRLSDKYGISLSTLKKYVKHIRDHLL
jgi:hypothetical protein